MDQGSAEWQFVRVGMITMSNLDKIITPKTLKPSASQDRYMAQLLSELWYRKPLDTFISDAMRKGHEQEGVSIDAYSFHFDKDLKKVGFIENDEGFAGCSPDAMWSDDSRGVEAKNPDPDTHALYRMKPDILKEKYWCQVQGCMWITGLPKWDLFSSNEIMPPVHIEVTRDEAFITAAAREVLAFNERFKAQKKIDGLPDRITA